MQNTFQPLTEEQYNKAVSAGFSPQQIIENEKKRKATSVSQKSIIPDIVSNIGDGIVNNAKSIGSYMSGNDIAPEDDSLFARVTRNFGNDVNDVVNSAKDFGTQIDKTQNETGNGFMGKLDNSMQVAGSGLKLGGEALKTVADPIGSAIGSGIETVGKPFIDQISDKNKQTINDIYTKYLEPTGKDVYDNYVKPSYDAVFPEGSGQRKGMEGLGDTVGAIANIDGGEYAVNKISSLASKVPGAVEFAKGAGSELADIGGNIKNGVGKIPTKIGSDSVGIMDRIARVTPSEAIEFKNMTGKSIGQYLVDTANYGNKDRVTERLLNDMLSSKSEVDRGLAEVQGTFRLDPVKTALEDLKVWEKKVTETGSPDPNSAKIKELYSKHFKEGLTMSEINEVKRIYERTVKLGYMKDVDTIAVRRANNIDSSIRNQQLELADKRGFKNLKELNKKTQTSKFLADAIEKKMNSQAGNNSVSLTDWIALSHPHGAVSLVGKKIFSSDRFQGWVAKKFGNKVAPEIKANLQPTEIKQLPGRGEYDTKTYNGKAIKVLPADAHLDYPTDVIGDTKYATSVSSERKSLDEIAKQVSNPDDIHVPQEVKVQKLEGLKKQLNVLDEKDYNYDMLKQEADILHDYIHNFDAGIGGLNLRSFSNMVRGGVTEMESGGVGGLDKYGNYQKGANNTKNSTLGALEEIASKGGATNARDISEVVDELHNKMARLGDLQDRISSMNIRDARNEMKTLRQGIIDLEQEVNNPEEKFFRSGTVPETVIDKNVIKDNNTNYDNRLHEADTTSYGRIKSAGTRGDGFDTTNTTYKEFAGSDGRSISNNSRSYTKNEGDFGGQLHKGHGYIDPKLITGSIKYKNNTLLDQELQKAGFSKNQSTAIYSHFLRIPEKAFKNFIGLEVSNDSLGSISSTSEGRWSMSLNPMNESIHTTLRHEITHVAYNFSKSFREETNTVIGKLYKEDPNLVKEMMRPPGVDNHHLDLRFKDYAYQGANNQFTSIINEIQKITLPQPGYGANIISKKMVIPYAKLEAFKKALPKVLNTELTELTQKYGNNFDLFANLGENLKSVYKLNSFHLGEEGKTVLEKLINDSTYTNFQNEVLAHSMGYNNDFTKTFLRKLSNNSVVKKYAESSINGTINDKLNMKIGKYNVAKEITNETGSTKNSLKR